ncbi:MAG TPA: hypothetical protein VF092_07375 [Longimicrobium sp.]
MREILVSIVAAALVAGAGRPAERRDAGGCPREVRLLVVAGQDLEVTPGETRRLEPPQILDGPFGNKPLPAGCRVRWSVRGGAATIGRDGILRVRPDAAPGDTFQVVASAAGQTAAETAYVVDPAPNPVAGRWVLREQEECADGSTPHEHILALLLRRNGRYAITTQPSMSDYGAWGRYTYDAATHRLSLGPPDDWQGGPRANDEYLARVDERGRLLVERVYASPIRQCPVTLDRVER